MRHFAIGAVLFAAIAAHAGDEMVLSDPAGDEIRLSQDACSQPAMQEVISDEWRPKFRRALVTIDGDAVQACWLYRDGAVIVIDERGRGGQFDAAAFRPAGKHQPRGGKGV